MHDVPAPQASRREASRRGESLLATETVRSGGGGEAERGGGVRGRRLGHRFVAKRLLYGGKAANRARRRTKQEIKKRTRLSLLHPHLVKPSSELAVRGPLESGGCMLSGLLLAFCLKLSRLCFHLLLLSLVSLDRPLSRQKGSAQCHWDYALQASKASTCPCRVNKRERGW